MFTVTVRDHMMVAHSFTGTVFGPAQRLHGATYVVDAAFSGPELGPDGILLDLGAASDLLHEVLARLTYRNLDDEPDLAGTNTFDGGASRALSPTGSPRVPPGSGRWLRLVVTLHELHVAWASYERAL